METNDSGHKLLEFATYNQMVLANTLGKHKKSRIKTWTSPDGKTGNQIDYILVGQRYRSSIHTASTRAFPKPDINSDHNLVLFKFRLHLRKKREAQNQRTKYDLKKLHDPAIKAQYEAAMQEKSSLILANEVLHDNIEEMLQALNNALTESAQAILGR